MGNAIDPDYKNFVKTIKSMVSSAQYEALRKVNKDLQAELPGVKGFSSQNLWYMRQFYIEYQGNLKLQPLVGEISWSKNVVKAC
jgi:predicted nuclease of restriction endonuclease-like (RecB) superfamily